MGTTADGKYQGKEVKLCNDGKYRWVYEMSFLTNPTIFLTVFKVFACIIIGMFLVFGIIAAIDGDWKTVVGMTKACGLVLAIFLGLTIISMFVMAAIYKGKYIVMFEMDEHTIKHIQVSEQFRKAKKFGQLSAFAGMMSGNFTLAGAGLLMSSKDASVSNYTEVRRVKPLRRMHVIKVNEFFEKNQIYVTDEDFDFVYDYIKSRCVNAKS